MVLVSAVFILGAMGVLVFFLPDYLTFIIEGFGLALGYFNIGPFRYSYGSNEWGRVLGAELAWREFLSKPLFGVGPRPVGLMYFASGGLVGGNHLYWLELLAWWGGVGFLLYLGLVISLFVGLKRNESNLHSLGKIMISVLAFICIMSIFAPWRADTWAIFGLCAACMRFKE